MKRYESLTNQYEDASGNTVNGERILDSGGRYVGDYSDDMARKYLGLDDEANPSPLPDLPETHPDYVYCIVQGVGIIREGRPIRGNFYCYKLDRVHAAALHELFDGPGSTSGEVGAFLHKYELRWCHDMDQDGFETTRGRPYKSSDNWGR